MADSAYIIERPVKPRRLQSLDALRGFDMFWIISGEGIFHGLAAATNRPVFNVISDQLHHSPWNGFTFYDMIFPLFIFIAGVSMPYSLGGQLEKAVNVKQVKRKIYRALLKRTLILILLGMVVNGLLQWKGYDNTRFASVLGRIGLSCFFAAIIYVNNSLRGQLAWFFILLAGYWLAMMYIPVPGFGAGVLTPEGNLSGYIDRVFLPGKLHRKVYDPEGLLSTIPAICSALLGVFAGRFLKDFADRRFSDTHKFLLMAAAGVLLLSAGWMLGMVFPVNKSMWTSSFVLVAGGWSLLLFALFYGIIDVAGYRVWSMPLRWVGMNSILIYMAAHGIVNFESTAGFLFGGIINPAPALWKPVILWTAIAIIQFVLLYFLYRKKWFLKV